jgi:para-nitrobenzyl esterase
MTWTRRNALLATAAAAAAPVLWRPLRVLASSIPSTSSTPPYVEVATAQGRVRGGHSRGALAFKGIPYAGSVTGDARFKEAPPPESWSGVRDALHLGPPSLQGPGTTYGENEPAYSENCLVLNVWTPAVNDGGKRPVMVYCHGGGYVSGSGGARDEDGGPLAATYDVVVVTTNHRLGLLGYLYLADIGGEPYATSGNAGMLDIVAALRWVKTNIEAFGGDPDNVMVWGESGGGFKVGTLLAMPAAQGLFNKACLESGAALRRVPRETAIQTTQRVLAALGIGSHELHKLAAVPGEKFIDLQLQAGRGQGPLARPSRLIRTDPILGPVVDGTVLPRQPFDPDAPPTAAAIPLIVGYNHDEATFFFKDQPEIFHMQPQGLRARAREAFGANADRVLSVYRKAYPKASAAEIFIAIATALEFGNDSITLAGRKAAQPAPVYAYRYDFPSNTPIPGTSWTMRASHSSDIAIMSLNYDLRSPTANGPHTAEVSRKMSCLWASFARDGIPRAPGVPAWPRYQLENRATMIIDAQCRVIEDPDRPIRQMWEGLRLDSRGPQLPLPRPRRGRNGSLRTAASSRPPTAW